MTGRPPAKLMKIRLTRLTRLTRFTAAWSAYALLWSVTLLIMLEDDAAMLAFMLS